MLRYGGEGSTGSHKPNKSNFRPSNTAVALRLHAHFLSGGNYLKNTAMLFTKMKDYASFQLKWLPNSEEF